MESLVNEVGTGLAPNESDYSKAQGIYPATYHNSIEIKTYPPTDYSNNIETNAVETNSYEASSTPVETYQNDYTGDINTYQTGESSSYVEATNTQDIAGNVNFDFGNTDFSANQIIQGSTSYESNIAEYPATKPGYNASNLIDTNNFIDTDTNIDDINSNNFVDTNIEAIDTNNVFENNEYVENTNIIDTNNILEENNYMDNNNIIDTNINEIDTNNIIEDNNNYVDNNQIVSTPQYEESYQANEFEDVNNVISAPEEYSVTNTPVDYQSTTTPVEYTPEEYTATTTPVEYESASTPVEYVPDNYGVNEPYEDININYNTSALEEVNDMKFEENNYISEIRNSLELNNTDNTDAIPYKTTSFNPTEDNYVEPTVTNIQPTEYKASTYKSSSVPVDAPPVPKNPNEEIIPIDEIVYVPVKKRKYIRRIKVPVKKTVVVPKKVVVPLKVKKTVIVPKKKIVVLKKKVVPVAKPPEIKIEPIPSPPISYTQTVGYLNEYTYMPRVYRKKI